MSKLTKEQEEVWDRLKNGIKFGGMSFSNPKTGDTYFNMLDKKLYIYDGIGWQATS